MCHTVLLLFLLLVLSVNNFTHISKYEYTFFVENIFCLPLQFPFSFLLHFLEFFFFLFLFFFPNLEHCEMFSFSCLNLQRFVVVRRHKTTRYKTSRRTKREERQIGGTGNAMIINKVAGAELATKKGFKMRDHRETRL